MLTNVSNDIYIFFKEKILSKHLQGFKRTFLLFEQFIKYIINVCNE